MSWLTDTPEGRHWQATHERLGREGKLYRAEWEARGALRPVTRATPERPVRPRRVRLVEAR